MLRPLRWLVLWLVLVPLSSRLLLPLPCWRVLLRVLCKHRQITVLLQSGLLPVCAPHALPAEPWLG